MQETVSWEQYKFYYYNVASRRTIIYGGYHFETNNESLKLTIFARITEQFRL